MSNGRQIRITNQMVDRNNATRREVEMQRGELKAFANETSKLLMAAGAQANVENRRRQAQLQQCRQEQQYEERIDEEQFQRRLKQLNQTQTQALATELDREAQDQERRRRELQRICEESPELKELEKALKLAVLNKERAVQLEEKNRLAAMERERIQAMEDQMEYERQRSEKQESEKSRAQKTQMRDQRNVLQQQIAERERQVEEAKIQTEIDKQMVDEIVARINMEDELTMQARRERQEMTTKLIKDYEIQRRRELAEKRAREKAEEDEILAFNKQVEERVGNEAAIRRAKKDEEDRILKKIVEESERKKAEDEEFNSLRDLLWEEELEAKRRDEDLNRKNKIAHMKRDMMAANEQMKQNKIELKRKEAEEELRIIAIMKQKFAEDELRERMEEEYKQQAKGQHKDAIVRQQVERRDMVEREKSKELQEREEMRRKEEYRKMVVQEARKRLLEEHAAKLAGYLPSSTFNNAEEYEAFQNATNRASSASSSSGRMR
eukprot:gene11763-24663_t